MPRIAVALEYDGAQFAGWQTQQAGVSSVQETAEAAFSRVAGEPVSLVCAGRTDAGVHALGQIVHFDTHAVRGERSWVLGANANLPDSISVRAQRTLMLSGRLALAPSTQLRSPRTAWVSKWTI